MRVYIAGPYTGGDTIVNVRNAIDAGDRVVKAGHTAFVPHMYHFWHFLFPGDYEQWMRLDFDWLRACDVLLLLPGTSPGAVREVDLARELGMPVFEGFGAEFWAHLKAGDRPRGEMHTSVVNQAIAELAKHEGAVVRLRGDGEFVVTW